MTENVNNELTKKIIATAEQKGLIKTYPEFCKTEEAKKYMLSEEEENYYISKNNKQMAKFNIGDIVFVSNYKYKNGETGENHSFVIIDKNQAIDINYFGFLISSNINKAYYPYNENLKKSELNGLYKDSIVKCDDLIEINESNVKFKIGVVSQKDLNRFLNTYAKYLNKKQK